MARRKTEAEKIAHNMIRRAEAEIRKRCDKVENIIPSWSGELIVLDVKDDGEWKRFQYSPESFIDARIMAEARGV